MAAKTKKGSTFDILDIDYEKQISNFVPRKGKNTWIPGSVIGSSAVDVR